MAGMGFFKRLVSGLTKTRENIVSNMDEIFMSYDEINEEFFEEIEEILIIGDIGVATAKSIMDEFRFEIKQFGLTKPMETKKLLIDSIKYQMRMYNNDYDFENKKSVILVIGVNGVGKTTSIGKLANQYKNNGKKVIIAAADTFRAAATEQLVTWAGRAGVDIITGQEGSDPGSVVYDAVASSKSKNADILIIDTAGRLHNKKNLMNELNKLYRIIAKEYPDAHLETFLVLDGTTGQNALVQARGFNEAADITGIIMTKLDGTAKGGIAIAVSSELAVPVKYIGVGEGIDDLQRFDPNQFVDALFDVKREDL